MHVVHRKARAISVQHELAALAVVLGCLISFNTPSCAAAVGGPANPMWARRPLLGMWRTAGYCDVKQ